MIKKGKGVPKLIAACLLLLHFGSVAQTPSNARATQVIVQSIGFEPITSTVEAVGTAEAVSSVDIYPAVGDKVTELNVAPGQWVEKNTILLQLDDRRQTIALKRAEIELKDASRNLKRLKRSREKGAVTESALDDAETRLELAKVALEEAKVELADRTVVAPFEGYVGFTDIEVGDRISTNTLITTLDDRKALFVNFTAPESAISNLANESKVSLQPWSNRLVEIDAQIAQIDSRISEQDRTIRVRAIFDNENDQYLPGMSFRVSLTNRGQSYAKIPESGLSWGASGAFIWLVEDSKATRVPVQIKQRLRGSLLVEGNINEGDIMIVEGIQRLRPQQNVRVVENGVS